MLDEMLGRAISSSALPVGLGRAAAREGLHVDVDVIWRDAVGGHHFGAAAAGQRLDCVGVLYAFVVARVRIAAVVAQPGGIVEDLRLGHAASFLVGITLGIDVL